MSTVSRDCQNHGQRPRGGGETSPLSSGSRGLAPGELRHLLPLCCSNPRRMVSPLTPTALYRAGDKRAVAAKTVRLCECEPRMMSGLKRVGACYSFKMPAKIAVFLLKKATTGFRVRGVWALSRIHCFFQTTACWLEARAETFPPFFLIPRCIAFAMPRRTGPP